MSPIDGELREALGELADIDAATEILAWDERTKMPERGGDARAEHLATLVRVAHERVTSDRLGRLLDAAASDLDGDGHDAEDASIVRVAVREREKALRIPAELRGEIARVTSLAEHAWMEARARSDFESFRPHLERVVELKRRYIDCFEVEHPYDALLDDFEPEGRTADVRRVLERLRDGLMPLVERVTALEPLDDSCLHGDFPAAEQRLLAADILERLPLPERGWRLDDTTHPFAAGIAPADIRLTTRYDPDYLGTSVWAVIHEAGHGMYEAGMPAELARTPVGTPRSLGLHESQSRLWEVWVGRGRPFVGALLPLLRGRFESFANIGADELYRAANAVRRSLIRVEADDLTYNLHIVIRFELELELFEGNLSVAELPEAWNARYAEYLGLDVPDDASGVLQDVHWAGGSFGYFPTYSLGNVIAAQLWRRARTELPDLDDRLAAGELDPLYEWLQRTLFVHAGKHSAAATVERALGEELDPQPLLEQLDAKFSELYGIGSGGR